MMILGDVSISSKPHQISKPYLSMRILVKIKNRTIERQGASCDTRLFAELVPKNSNARNKQAG
jgi:hypothetical protein